MLRMWNMALIVLTFSLTILGTFVTRSGIIESVHAFASTNVGIVFLSFLTFVIATSVGLIWWRSDLLKTENRLESFVSRESAFLFNNLLLLGIAFAIWWGTFFPILSEAFTGQRISVGPPFFNQVNGPLSIGLLLTLGIGPLIAWRRASRQNVERNFRVPVLVLLLAGVAAVALGLRAWYAVSVVAFSAFVAATVVQEMWRGTRARMRSKGTGPAASLIGLISRNRRRYGGYIVHIGVLFVFAGVAGSMFQLEQKAHLSPGDEIAIGGYRVEYRGGDIEQGPNYTATVANLTVSGEGGTPYRVRPERRFYPSGQEQTTSEVAIWSRMFEDFYAILEAFDPATGNSDITLIVNPMLLWIWIGGGVMVFGTLIALSSPRPKAARRPDEERGEDAERAGAVIA